MPGRLDDDEGPSEEDVARFGGEESSDDDPDDLQSRHRRERRGFCPQCGAEVYEDADLCPKCFAWITGDVVRRHPQAAALGKRALAAIGILLAGFLAYLALRGAL